MQKTSFFPTDYIIINKAGIEWLTGLLFTHSSADDTKDVCLKADFITSDKICLSS